MAALTLRLKTRNGHHVLQHVDKQTSLDELQMTIAKLTSIPSHSQRILQGYPPRPLDTKDGKRSLAMLSLQSGETLIVEEDQNAKAEEAQRINENLLNELQYQEQNAQGILTRRVVPANNSCLFLSVDYVTEHRVSVNLNSAQPMRELIATVVASDKTTYNEAMLGKSNKDYCKWIRNKESWGGAIEIFILSKYYDMEIDVVDTQSGRIDRFGEDQNYSKRILIIYDGIHYDPLVMESLDPSNPTITTVFPTSDDGVLIQAQEIAAEAKSSRQFTDVNQFSLRCLICQTCLRGQTEAQAHAKSTGHINFGEV